MDGSRFDQMTKSLASSSRRSLLKMGAGSALGLALSGIGLNGARAAVRRGSGEICRKHGDCASGVCNPKDATGRRRCGCETVADCPPLTAGGVCEISACVEGVCSSAIDVGAACDDGNLCMTEQICQADGSCVGTPVTCTPLSQCHDAGVCDPQTGVCSNPTKADGAACDDGNASSTGETCQSGICTCTPTSTDCGTKECGTGLSNCGQPVSCGECESTETCNDSGMCEAVPTCAGETESCSIDDDCCSGLFCSDGMCNPGV